MMTEDRSSTMTTDELNNLAQEEARKAEKILIDKTFAVMGTPIVDNNYCWCICGKRHIIKRGRINKVYEVECSDLKQHFKAGSRRSLAIKTISFYALFISKLDEVQALRANEVLIVRRLQEDAAATNRLLDFNSKLSQDYVRSYVRNLWNKSYIKQCGYDVNFSGENNEFVIDFSKKVEEQNVQS